MGYINCRQCCFTLIDNNMCTLVGITQEQYDAVKAIIDRNELAADVKHEDWFEPVWFNNLVVEDDRTEDEITITFAEILKVLQTLRDAILDVNDDSADDKKIVNDCLLLDEICSAYLCKTDWYAAVSKNSCNKRYMKNFYNYLIAAELLK